MPTIARIGGVRVFFFSNEGSEPAHVHVESGECYAKLWLHPVAIAPSVGYNSRDLNRLKKMVEERAAFFRERWDEHFGTS